MSSKSNKFAGLNATKRVNEGKKQAEEAEPIKQEQPISAAWTQFADQTQKKLGRPAGKRSNAEYQQVTAYIRRDTYRQTKKILFDSEGAEFSELVEELLANWLKKQK